jgi:hypothetical protein
MSQGDMSLDSHPGLFRPNPGSYGHGFFEDPQSQETVVMPPDHYYAVPLEHEPTEPKKRKKGVVLIVVLASLLALGIVLAAGVLLWTKVFSNAGAQSATEAVETYLTALAAGDAPTALAQTAQLVEDTTFLTSEFLSAAQRDYPITNIKVPEGQQTTSPAQITATYNLGDVEVEAHFTVQQHGFSWLLDGGFMNLNVTDLVEKLPLSLNGVDVSTLSTVALFPGVYTLETSQPYVTMTDPELVINFPEGSPAFTWGVNLTDEAVTMISEAAAPHLSSCLARLEMLPGDCGFGIANSEQTQVSVDSIKWTLTSAQPDFTTLDWVVDSTTFNVAEANLEMTIDFDALTPNRRNFFEASLTTHTVRADFSDLDNIQILFF